MNSLEQLRTGRLAGATRLDLNNLGLAEVPPEVFGLADTLEVLNLSGNRLTTLPAELPRLKHLKVVFCSDNPFDTLPPVLGTCPALEMIGFKACQIASVPAESLPPALRWLILTDNRITRLPNTFERFPGLQKLMLAGNQLRELPPSLAGCERLELLRIACNHLLTLPAWLLGLPRLAWLAYAGNPFCAPLSSADSREQPLIPWQSLAIEHLLGQGASGAVYQARLASGLVAVKVFKGARTSDGSPEDEIAACLHAGRHPNLVPMRARLTGHPDGLPGLVMDLIDPAYQILAGPPSLHSCTRDHYSGNTRFSAPQAQAVALGVANAAAHLHGRGVMHGDLYGHNLLLRGDGHALLGDFGAASRYAPDGSAMAQALEAIEVRAFGILLEEVHNRCDAAQASWQALIAACQQPNTLARPSFAQVVEALNQGG
jgi:hypothetical protein